MRGTSKTLVVGLIVGNRGFFPDALVEGGRARILKALGELEIKVITLSPADTKYGAVESWDDAVKCARLLRAHADDLDGIIVSLPNFGDEKAVAEALRGAGVDVPVLVQAFPDELEKLDVEHRRDAFCGKISLCNNLVQYGIRFTDTTQHVESPESPYFQQDLQTFLAICRVLKGLRRARLGAVGARPSAFNTVRFSEKILEKHGISVETIDLSEVIAQAQSLDPAAREVQQELERLREAFSPHGIPQQALTKMACLSAVLHGWIKENSLDAIAVQCWTAIEKLYGIVPCAVMSLLSESLIPSACELDVMGALSMYTLQLAADSPAAVMDWNNNFGDDPDKVITFHCSNFPPSFFKSCRMSYQHIIASTVGKKNTYGTCEGRVSPGPATFFRLSSRDAEGCIAAYLAEGRFTEDEVDTFGGVGVAEIPRLRSLLQLITQTGFEHHVAVVKAHVAGAVAEAVGKYLSWDIHVHNGEV